MATLLAVVVLGVVFAVFALLGPAEAARPCGGEADDGSDACDTCPAGAESGCALDYVKRETLRT